MEPTPKEKLEKRRLEAEMRAFLAKNKAPRDLFDQETGH